MELNNEFEQKLAQMKQAETDIAEKMTKDEEEQKRLAVERKTNFEARRPLRVEELQRHQDEIIKPLFESINTYYLHKQGKISQKINEDASELSMSLDWDTYPDSGKSISLKIKRSGTVYLREKNGSVYGDRFEITDKDFMDKFQDRIIEGLSKREFYWESSGRNTN